MTPAVHGRGLWLRGVRIAMTFAATIATAGGPPAPLPARANFGPYNAVFLGGGIGILRPLAPGASLLAADAPWSLSGWIWVDTNTGGPRVVASIGESDPRRCRCLLLDSGQPVLRLGTGRSLSSASALEPNVWHFLAATYDGNTARLYVDGDEPVSLGTHGDPVAASLSIAPESPDDPAGERHFGGSVAALQLDDRALEAAAVRARYLTRPDFGLVQFHQVGVGWPWQERAWRGLLEPQPAWTLPKGRARVDKPVSRPPAPEPALRAVSDGVWSLGSWRMAVSPAVGDDGMRIASAGYADDSWYRAVVPGTALTTLIANGVYPDPDIGLNNLAIPESLNRQDYWFRTEFATPDRAADQQFSLLFKGINYAAQVWLNGTRLGEIRGAFIRGTFDVSKLLRPDATNALAVRLSPPPHPGIPHEQSVAAGPGENGGNLAIDGPTFIASEGWDWIPAVRDRNTGLWQGVELRATGGLRLLDPQVVTRLPLPRTDSADLEITVPVDNRTGGVSHATVTAAFDDVRISHAVTLAPGVSEIRLSPREFPQLHLRHPRLWWPNGYGAQELHDLTLQIADAGVPSEERRVRFGIRELTYELSLFDGSGRLRRVEVDPAFGRERGEALVDVRHEAIKRTATGWAASLTHAGESSPAVRDIATASLTPYLAIRVNGVPIAARGGSWGTDDSRKRISRERLEPYFRLHRDAHLNIIRNWLGQNTEDVFYDLADEYGLLVLNDFWASTQDFQVEPQDPQLFLENAGDVIRRYRNHPSIAIWFGRNEGVPQPVLNEGLAGLVGSLDGTRYYTGSSNVVNLQGSGPYNWRPPQQYFTELARGFSVEVGTPSLASLETLKASIPPEDRWPLGDTFAYHDWHFGGNGDTATFMGALESGLGKASSLEDFERKAQLMNYDSYRAIFEGFQAHLWTHNSGRLLWMTHPAWPSNAWQIYTSDYDTAAAYYAVAKACEPLHAQLNLPDFSLAVVNTTRERRPGLTLTSRILSAAGQQLQQRTERVTAAANSVTTLSPLPLEPVLRDAGLVFVVLELRDGRGQLLSRNVYWQADSDAHEQRLSALSTQPLAVTAHTVAGRATVDIAIRNPGPAPALLTRIMVVDERGERVLPAYYSDNYVSLMPGESTHITAQCPEAGRRCRSLSIRGWNVPGATVSIVTEAPGRSVSADRSHP